MHLTGGSLLGSGQISVNANPNNGGGLISGGGTIQNEVIMNGGILRADNPLIPLIVLGLSQEDASSQLIIASNSVMNIQTPFTNFINIGLQGSGARLVGGTISNSSLIKGTGEISNQIVNSGLIRADGGPLTLSSPNIANLTSGELRIGANAMHFPQGLQVNNGLISLTEGEFDNGIVTMSNTGTFLGRGTIRAGTLSTSGTMSFSGGVSDVFATIVNTNRISIAGSGVVNFHKPVNTSSGTLTVNLGSTAVFYGNVTGAARITGAGVKHFEASASLGAINTINGTTIAGSAATLSASSIRDGTLSVVGRVNISPNGGPTGTSRVNSLIIDGSTNNWLGRLDLADNDLVIDYTGVSPIEDVKNQIRFGFSAGSFIGNGITTSMGNQQRRLGYAEAAALGLLGFSGQGVDATSLLIKYTYAGDANLDGIVNGIDLGRLAQAWNSSGDWSSGDFNYSGTVDVADLHLLATNWNAGAGAPLGPTLDSLGLPSVAVPEPGALAAVVIGCLGLLHRRRRQLA